MRNIFDSKKEHKSLKLVKKLQEQADLEWEKEVQKRREQELNDEAIAKELQAELEDEQRRNSSSNNNNTSTSPIVLSPVTHSLSPPPLPSKPRAYNSSSSLLGNSSTLPSSSSASSLPTSVTPLYGLNNSLPSRQTPQHNKSYLQSQTYKPELHFALSSPAPSPNTVFYQKTPAITPATTATATTTKPLTPYNNIASTPATTHIVPPQSSNYNSRPISPATVIEPPKNIMSMPEPADIISYTPVPASAPSSYPQRQPTSVSRPPPPLPPMNYQHQHHSDPIVPQQSYSNTPPPLIPNNNNNNYQRHESSPPISLPLSTNDILKNVFTTPSYQPSSQQSNTTPPYQPPVSQYNNNFKTPIVSSTNPYFKQQKPLFSNSVLSLKPDEDQPKEEEEEEDWDNVPIKRVHTPPPVPAMAISDNESEIDYSDMFYDRRNEEQEIDPFADSFAVEVPKSSLVQTLEPSSIQILDPTILSRKLSGKTAVEHKEKTAKEEEEERTYVEKESEEIEQSTPFIGFKTPLQQHASEINQTRPVYTHQQSSSPAFFHHSVEEEEQEAEKVYPTNILKAGPPTTTTIMSENNPYTKKQGAVPSTDYGYYDPIKTNKTLPKLPVTTTNQEDRHITVASINPGQRVWIRIHPTDTGKMLAERIHIVASYQTRKVTKITTTQGRNISLDNSPLFDDWNEIINFKEGEAWTVEWIPIEHPYVDIITEGKEFMKQLKANFKGSSSS